MDTVAFGFDEAVQVTDNPPRMLSIVIPAFNEEAVISDTLRTLAARLDADAIDYELLVINDGSCDRTVDIVEALERALPRLRHFNSTGSHGYGYAVRCGLMHYRGDAVAVVMADGSDSPEDVVRYFSKLREGYECAFGHRFTGQSTVKGYPRVKALCNRAGNCLIAKLTGQSYTDFTNGFKCFRRHVVERMLPLVSGEFNLTVEMSIKAVLSGARYAVVPNDWSERAGGKSKFGVGRMCKLYLITIAYCFTRHWLLHKRVKR